VWPTPPPLRGRADPFPLPLVNICICGCVFDDDVDDDEELDEEFGNITVVPTMPGVSMPTLMLFAPGPPTMPLMLLLLTDDITPKPTLGLS